MAAGVLQSDHINYLILRYLQEKGHESAATAFYTEWRRPAQFRDPESLPFASDVRRDELISVIQEGLHYDELNARVRESGQRRFQWMGGVREGATGRLHHRHHSTTTASAPLENGTVGSAAPRPSSSAKRKGRPAALRAGGEEFPTPAPKRQRRSEGSEGVQVNGDRDAMDVDVASASADAEDDVDVASPAVVSPEPEIIEVPERYDSMDVATQTDIKSRTKTTTMTFKIDKPGSMVLHSLWNPSPDAKNVGTLMTVGESLCRFYRIAEDISDVKQVTHIEDPSIPSNSVVTACAWHPNGRRATCAVDTARDLGGIRVSRPYLIDYCRDTGSVSRYLDLPFLEPPGIVMKLQYSADGRYLLAVRSNPSQGLLVVYSAAESTNDLRRPIAWHLVPYPVIDAAWFSNDSFTATSGDLDRLVEADSLAEFGKDPILIMTVAEDAVSKETQLLEQELTSSEVEEFGITNLARIASPHWTSRWDIVRGDAYTNSVAAVSRDGKRLVTINPPLRKADADDEESLRGHDLSNHPMTMEFQPAPRIERFSSPSAEATSENQKMSLLAVAMEGGECDIWQAQDNGIAEPLCTLRFADTAPLAVAWSPYGEHLAIAATDVIQIWREEDITTTQRAFVTWRRPGGMANGITNGVHDQDGEPQSEPCLSWSADGQNLCFAIDGEINVIRLRPPPISTHESNGVNGARSP